MSLVRLENISKSFAGDEVLREVNLRIEEGEHVGLIGRNGTGKSTIFRLILGETEPDKGLVDRMKRARVASLAQLPQVDNEATIFDIVLHSFQDLLDLERELEALEAQMEEGSEEALETYSEKQDQFSVRGGYDFRVRIKQVLQGLGFLPEEFSLPFRVLSGGQRTRLMLALVLLKDADLLLLDEPENHLDLEAREWLESYLKEFPRAVVIISHDRRMLNHVVDRIIEIERGEVRSFTGNYEYYLREKELIREQQQAAFDRQQEYIRKEEVWIDRFRYKATKARQAQSRLKRLEKLERVEAPQADAAVAKFNLGEVVRSGAVVLDAQNLKMGYGKLILYRDVTFQVHRGERIGIIGPNGSGKTTLLRQLAGEHPGLSGEVRLGHKTSVGFYRQNHEHLNPANDILRELLEAKPEWTPEQIRSYAGRFLFTGEDVFKTIKALSGGELSRVAIAKLILSGANLLLLDEPTNHLDIASREALEQALAAYPGTLIIISHDRALIDRLVDRLIIVEEGRALVHLGNYTDYLGEATAAAAAPVAIAPKDSSDVLRIRRDSEKKKTERQREDRKAQRRLEQLEGEIAAMEALVEGFDSRFAALDPADYQRGRELTDEYDALKKDLRALYEAWEEMAR